MGVGINSEIYKSTGDWYSEKYEVNPVSNGYHDEDLEYMNWEDFKELVKSRSHKIEVLRIRFIADSGFPFFELSYFHTRIDGIKTEILDSPFHQVRKKFFNQNLYSILKKEGIYLPDFFNRLSTLV